MNTRKISKNILRQESKRNRATLSSDYRHQASLAICDHIQDWPIFQNSTTILTYMAMGSEVDLSPLLARYPQKEWGIPRVQTRGQMVFHIFNPEKLIRHPYGMMEPDPLSTIIPSERVQLTLVPGLAFDLQGWRLGYGGGFYDRFLSHQTGKYAGITYQNLLQSQVPHDSHDIPMQFIITENGISSTA